MILRDSFEEFVLPILAILVSEGLVVLVLRAVMISLGNTARVLSVVSYTCHVVYATSWRRRRKQVDLSGASVGQ